MRTEPRQAALGGYTYKRKRLPRNRRDGPWSPGRLQSDHGGFKVYYPGDRSGRPEEMCSCYESHVVLGTLAGQATMSTKIEYVPISKSFRRKRAPVKVMVITGKAMSIAPPKSVKDFQQIGRAAEQIRRKIVRRRSSGQKTLQNIRLHSTLFR